MELINRNQYTNESLINKRFYLHKSTKDNEIYYIFKLESIEDSFPVIYNTIKQYHFCVPNDKRTNCFCYDDGNKVEVRNEDNLYQISENEYLDLFRKFVKYDGNDKYNIDIDFKK